MTGSTSSPTEMEVSAQRRSPTDKYDPLLHLLRMILVEAYRYQKTANTSHNEFHSRSIKALFYQLDYLWDQLQGEPLQKYEFLRGRLAVLLLWHNSESSDERQSYFSRSMMTPPIHMSNVFRTNRQRLLSALRPGELFVTSEIVEGQ